MHMWSSDGREGEGIWRGTLLETYLVDPLLYLLFLSLGPLSLKV